MVSKRISRDDYLNKLIAFKDKQLIKVITGIRRCGKSTIMEIYQDYLQKEMNVTKKQIIAINLEDYDFYDLRDPKKLYAYIKERLLPDQMNYIFLDEIQQCEDFPRVVDSLYIKNNVDLYVTGSNANMLSSEIATLLSGRYVEIKMLPLSFKEYVESTGNENDLQRKYTTYLENSSFPYALELAGHPKEIRDYLDGIYNTIIVKDIAQRHKITDTMMSDGRKIDVRAVEKYLAAFMESYVIYQAKRYNIKGKQYLKTLEKYYVADIGLRYMLLGSRSTDVGHILENVIYLELIRRGYDVYVGKLDDLEVDFVCMDQKRTIYYQVAATVRDEKTLKRELLPLQKIHDHYQKILLTLDEDPEADYEGIRRINALDWLIGKTE